MNHILNSFIPSIPIILILILISYYRKEYFTVGYKTVSQEDISTTLKNLYINDLKVDFNTIFPSRNRNGGGAHFFKYAYDRFIYKSFSANQFENFHKIYCAVSGSPIQPQGDNISRTSDLKLKKLSINKLDEDLTDEDFVIGKYYRCCTPCICDLMKHSVVTDTKIPIFNDDGDMVELYLILIKNPCNHPDLIPSEAPAFECGDNGMLDSNRVLYLNEITGDSEDSNYLIIGVLYDHPNQNQYNLDSDMANFKCQARFTSNNPQGGMGKIFIELSKAGLDDSENHLGYIP